MLDCIIVGGGPAGLQAALILGRCMRKVVLFDDGKQRNLHALSLNAYLTRDGISPQKFLEISHQELAKYQDIILRKEEVVAASRVEDSFKIITAKGDYFYSKTVLIATGVIDSLPNIQGFMELYGRSIFTCPYCDAWEVRGKSLAVYGKGKRAVEMALGLSNWSEDILVCTDGGPLNSHEEEKILQKGMSLKTEKIIKLLGDDGQLQEIVFEDGTWKRDAMFFNSPSFIRSKLLEQLGCPYDEKKGAIAYDYERTEVPGVFVAGNILRDVQLVIVAASDGAQAALGINKYLSKKAPSYQRRLK